MQLLVDTALARVGGLVVALAITGVSSAQTILYVDDDAPPGGNGQGWATAYRFLQDALAAASQPGAAVDEIHVGQGLNKPDRGEANPSGTSEREATFQLIEDLALMGGYAGIGAPDPDERNIALYETILSGDLAGDDEPNFVNYDENSYHVVSGSNVDATAVIDGFTITSGNADGFGVEDRHGGGMHLNAADPAIIICTFNANRAEQRGGGMYNAEGSSPQLTACAFDQNQAPSGSGIANIYGSSPELADCSFTANLSGAAFECATDCDPVLVDCSFAANADRAAWFSDHCDPVFNGCTFSQNEGFEGGAIRCLYGCFITLTGCVFIENHGTSIGGAVQMKDGCGGELTGCQFTGNTTWYDGGAIYVYDGTDLTLTDCLFSGNTTTDPMLHSGLGGGGLCVYKIQSLTMNGCAFEANTAKGWGGGINFWDVDGPPSGQLVCSDCTFVGNSGHYASAVYCRSEASTTFSGCQFSDNFPAIASSETTMVLSAPSVTLTGCDIADNTTHYGIGGIWAPGDDLTLIDCRITGNTGYHSGSLACSGNATLINCLISDNESRYSAGVSNSGAATLINCTVLNNHALEIAGGVGNSGTLTLVSSILWGNTDSGGAGEAAQLSNYSGAQSFVDYSCIQGWTGNLGGVGNFGDDPLLADPDGRLGPGSPCIDAGDNTAVPPDILTDLDGNPRFVDDPLTPDTGFGDPPIVDMGAYEFQADGCPADVNGDAVVNVLDMLAVLAAWGATSGPEDINADGIVDVLDLLAVLGAWGPC